MTVELLDVARFEEICDAAFDRRLRKVVEEIVERKTALNCVPEPDLAEHIVVELHKVALLAAFSACEEIARNRRKFADIALKIAPTLIERFIAEASSCDGRVCIAAMEAMATMAPVAPKAFSQPGVIKFLNEIIQCPPNEVALWRANDVKQALKQHGFWPA